MTIVSFQGEHGAYSEAATLELFPNAKTIPCSTFAKAVDAIKSAKSEYAVIPVENSIAGSVGEIYDVLLETDLCIIAETYHHIIHCLISRGSLDKISTVYSHPQALAQCRKFIESHNLKTVPTYDTAGSVTIIEKMESDSACIASEHVAKTHNMPIIQKGISDKTDNYTRFVVLAQNPLQGAPPTDKTSIIASLPHKQSALYSLLSVFSKHEINLTRIESRPKKEESWEYDFFIDFVCDSKSTAEALKDTKKLGIKIKKLGSYTAAQMI